MPTILVVDDDPEVADMLRLGLEQHTFAVTVAHDGAGALSHTQTQHFDLILLDVRMPGLNGFAVLHTLRAAGTDARIIVLSADGGAADQRRARLAGADAYLVKPFRLRHVIQQVQALLQIAC
jgi:DNA-binding response OmpR family regulator